MKLGGFFTVAASVLVFLIETALLRVLRYANDTQAVFSLHSYAITGHMVMGPEAP